MTHLKEYNNSSKQLIMSYFVDDSFNMLMSDDEEDECFIELDTNSNTMLSSRQKFSLFRKKRLLYSSKKRNITKRINVKARRTKSKLYRNNAKVDGTYDKIKPEQTYWYRNYVLFPNLGLSRFERKFRLRFRLPRSAFTSLLESIKDSHYFSKWDPNFSIKVRKNAVP